MLCFAVWREGETRSASEWFDVGNAEKYAIYRERADYFRNVISKTQGLDSAADIIEQAFQKYQTEVPCEEVSSAETLYGPIELQRRYKTLTT